FSLRPYVHTPPIPATADTRPVPAVIDARSGVWKDLPEAGQIKDVRRVEPALHIQEARVRDTIEIPPKLFAPSRFLLNDSFDDRTPQSRCQRHWAER
ncbi:MAG: hypothetical protein ACRERE_41275, partial [Candidatus Entotheonellia bacterium]